MKLIVSPNALLFSFFIFPALNAITTTNFARNAILYSYVTADFIKAHPKSAALGIGCSGPLLYRRKMDRRTAMLQITYSATLFLALQILNEADNYQEHKKATIKKLETLAEQGQTLQKSINENHHESKDNFAILQKLIEELQKKADEQSQAINANKELLERLKTILDELQNTVKEGHEKAASKEDIQQLTQLILRAIAATSANN